MNYDTLADLYLRPPPGHVTPPPVPQTPARRLRDALEPIATHAWWCRPTNEAMEENGLLFFPAYVWGRAASLGEPPAELVQCTFAVFEPNFLAGVYGEGRAACSREEILALREGPTVTSLGSVVSGDEVPRVAGLLRRAVQEADGTGRPLFCGLRSLSWPDAPVGQLWRAAEMVREHRGDSHIAVCVAAGLDPVEMTVLTELWLGMPLGSYLLTRGFVGEPLELALATLEERGWVADRQLTPTGRHERDRIEQQTDELQAGIVRALGDELDGVVEAANRWSDAVIAAGAFPGDPHKRAAG